MTLRCWILLCVLHLNTAQYKKVAFFKLVNGKSFNVPKQASLFNSSKDSLKIFHRSENNVYERESIKAYFKSGIMSGLEDGCKALVPDIVRYFFERAVKFCQTIFYCLAKIS